MVFSIYYQDNECTWNSMRDSDGDNKIRDELLLIYLRIKGIIILDGIIYDNKIEWKKEEEYNDNNDNNGAHDPFGDVGADVELGSARQKLPDWVRIEVIRWRRPEYRFFFYPDQASIQSEVRGETEDEYQVLCVRLEDEYKVPIIREFVKDPDNSISSNDSSSNKIILCRGNKPCGSEDYYYDSDPPSAPYVDAIMTDITVPEIRPWKARASTKVSDHKTKTVAAKELYSTEYAVPDSMIAEYSRISVSTIAVLKEIDRIIKEEGYGDEYSILLEDNNMAVREQVSKKLLSYYIEYSKEIMSKVGR